MQNALVGMAADALTARVYEHQCIKVTLEAQHKRRRGAGGPARPALSENPRFVPAALRDQVWARDGGACSFVAADGRRCGSTWQVEVHHVQPVARGGQAALANLTLACRRHNVYLAERDFGAEQVARVVAERQGELF